MAEHDYWPEAEAITLRPGDTFLVFDEDNRSGRYQHFEVVKVFDREGWVPRLVVRPGIALAAMYPYPLDPED